MAGHGVSLRRGDRPPSAKPAAAAAARCCAARASETPSRCRPRSPPGQPGSGRRGRRTRHATSRAPPPRTPAAPAQRDAARRREGERAGGGCHTRSAEDASGAEAEAEAQGPPRGALRGANRAGGACVGRLCSIALRAPARPEGMVSKGSNGSFQTRSGVHEADAVYTCTCSRRATREEPLSLLSLVVGGGGSFTI